MPYVELHACSAFSFLRGGSFPEQLAEVAAELEMLALALCDRNGVYGAQRFSVAAREHGIRPIIGCGLSMEDGAVLPVLVENRTGYKNLCELLTKAHLRSEKGKCAVRWNELPQFAKGLIAFLGSARLQRAGFGILPKRTSTGLPSAKSSRMQNAFASTLQACAPRNKWREIREAVRARSAGCFHLYPRAHPSGCCRQIANPKRRMLFEKRSSNASHFRGFAGSN